MIDQRRKQQLAAIAVMAVFVIALGVSQANPAQAEKQPRVERAIALLIEAREQLQKASTDKGGHRVRAINQINKALTEIRKGIRYDNRN